MMNTTPIKNTANRDDTNINSKTISDSTSPSSVRQLHHHMQQQLSNQRQWNNKSGDNINNNKAMNTPKQRKKSSAPMPAPFLSSQVEREDCAVYVGNIPADERSPGQISGNKTVPGDTRELSDDEHNSACAVELKAFLRDRINAAFKVPLEEIGIRSCRLFSVVTNVYSNNDTTDSTNDNDGSEARQRPGRRVHRAACVEFDDPKIAEHCLALKFTSFHFNGQSHNRSNLRMRRWTSQPPAPPEKKNPGQPLWSPKQPPPPPRSKSVSPKLSNPKRKQVPPPPPLRPKSAQQVRRKQLSLSTVINEKPISLLSPPIDTTFSASDDTGGRISPPPLSSCMIYVGNIPSGATCEELREFFLGRMNKAFHGVTPPEIVRLGMRHSGNYHGSPNRTDACVEFQEPKVATRATLLRNRRWHAKDDDFQNDDELDDDWNNNDSNHSSLNQDSNHSSLSNRSNHSHGSSHSNHSEQRGRRGGMPVLEIELWDPSKHCASDFFLENEISTNNFKVSKNTILGSTFYEESAQEEDPDDYGLLRTSPKVSPKSSPSQTKQLIEEAREKGFLTCSNANKIPKCNHQFSILPQPGEDASCLEVKRARMCHGYAFMGKACRNFNKKRNSKKLCGSLCPFVHIDSFDQLKDPHDILSLLYFVENNNDVEFSSGLSYTPQEYLQRNREWQPRVENAITPTKSNPLNQQFTEGLLQELRISLTAVRQELSATQQQLRNSEFARQSLIEQQSFLAGRNASEDDKNKNTIILTLREEVARLKTDLQETNHKLKASELSAENDRRDYEFLKEKYQHHVSREGKSGISTELLESEIIKLREELKKSQANCQALEREKKQGSSASPNSDYQEPWPGINLLDTFLEKSTPSLMQMMDSSTEHQLKLDLAPKPRLADIPIDSESPLQVPYKAVADNSPIQSLGLASPMLNTNPNTNTNTTTTQIPTPVGGESLQSEISYLMSCYGNQVFVNKNASDGCTIVTRFLKLPVNFQHGRDIDVALVLTVSKDYPWNGIIDIHSDPRFLNHFGADSQHRKLVSESISGLLNVCRWEAEACRGKPHVLMNIMKAAERWVINDWKIIQKKKWATEYDTEESHLSK